ncbi:endonuclease/exonuclease/phosphatase family protein [Lacticaseibacillus absianus]|uniref:endonuclease/exonuclease/phosphatase family protein n=1 Tax=Lacticaseibacillus absianus TaxID=2729623 RepID=UPI0015CD4696|nr:endonuclease/exonuclease/phosphatase family protein [Lacticaseibacillus absianus]
MRLMTYNLRVDAPEDGSWRWSDRAQTVLTDIQRNDPDILIVTEAEAAHLAALTQLTAYAHVAVPRDDGHHRGEAVGLFWRADRFHCVAEHHEWLSETPDRPSRYPGARYPRTLQQITLATATGSRWTVIGTHLDHRSAAARDFGARRLQTLARQLPGPLLIGGDFNAGPTSSAYRLMTTVLADAQVIAKTRHRPYPGTYRPTHQFTPTAGMVTARIDYLFVSRTLPVKRYAIDATLTSGRWGSDHWPVIADIG